MDIFLNYLTEHLPTFVLVLVFAVCLLIFVVWRLAKMWHDFKSLPCSEHTSSISLHKDKISEIAQSLSRIDGNIEMLLKLLPVMSANKENVLSNDIPVLSKKNSPKVLNANGVKVSESLKCDDFFANNKDWLVDKLSLFSPKTALDTETFSLAALRIASSDDRFNDIKKLIYNSPYIKLEVESGEEKDFEITLDDVLFVLSLYLRDEYLTRHPEIN